MPVTHDAWVTPEICIISRHMELGSERKKVRLNPRRNILTFSLEMHIVPRMRFCFAK